MRTARSALLACSLVAPACTGVALAKEAKLPAQATTALTISVNPAGDFQILERAEAATTYLLPLAEVTKPTARLIPVGSSVLFDAVLARHVRPALEGGQ